MSKSTSKVALVGCLLAVVVVALCIVLSQESTKADESRFRQMVRAERWSSRIRSTERYLPLFLIKALRLERSRLDNEDAAQTHREALLSSGFLTNAILAITNLPVTASNRQLVFLEIYRRFRTLKGIDYWSFHIETNRAITTCRPRDVTRIRTAIETP